MLYSLLITAKTFIAGMTIVQKAAVSSLLSTAFMWKEYKRAKSQRAYFDNQFETLRLEMREMKKEA